MDLAELRALADDHANKDAGLTVDVEVCLKSYLYDDLQEAQARLVEAQSHLAGSMAEGGADTSLIDDEIETIKAEVEKATITVHFKALLEPEMRKIVRRHPNANSENPGDLDDYLIELADACFQGISYQGEPIEGATPNDWRGKLTYGECEPVLLLVNGLNRRSRVISRPKSSRG